MLGIVYNMSVFLIFFIISSCFVLEARLRLWKLWVILHIKQWKSIHRSAVQHILEKSKYSRWSFLKMATLMYVISKMLFLQIDIDTPPLRAGIYVSSPWTWAHTHNYLHQETLADFLCDFWGQVIEAIWLCLTQCCGICALRILSQ